MVELADGWLRVMPSEGQKSVDALLLETQPGTHEEPFTAPMALSTEGEKADIHHHGLADAKW